MGLSGCGNHCCDPARDCPCHRISKANDQGIHARVRKRIEREEGDAVMRSTQGMIGQSEHEHNALLYRFLLVIQNIANFTLLTTTIWKVN
jgi:hypothetical protein